MWFGSVDVVERGTGKNSRALSEKSTAEPKPEPCTEEICDASSTSSFQVEVISAAE